MNEAVAKPAPWWRWPLLAAMTIVLVAALMRVHVPAAALLGAIVAGIAAALIGDAPSVPRWSMLLAQGLLGSMISHILRADLFAEMAKDWPLFACMTVAVIVLSSALGWVLAWKKVLPGTTAIWGSAPGAASAMMLMAQAYGADARLTAFMQYLRVVLVAAVASMIAASIGAHGAKSAFVLFPTIHWAVFGAGLAVAVGGVLIAQKTKIHAGALLLPMIGGIVLQDVFGVALELPPWLMLLAYAALGWSIGLRFTLPLLKHAFAALPKILLAIIVLIAACAGLGYVLHLLSGRDLLTSYLATSPGGADSVAIIAASSHVDVSFVMAMQVARFMLVLLVGPRIARWVARTLPADAAAEAES